MVQRFAGTSSEKNLINYQEFFSNLGTDLNPTDMKGISNEIIENNRTAVESQKKEHEQKSVILFKIIKCSLFTTLRYVFYIYLIMY